MALTLARVTRVTRKAITRCFETLMVQEKQFLSKRRLYFTTVALSSKPDQSKGSFDVRMLNVLACPLSKKPLRYDAENSELICDDLGVAYPIVNGIPNLNPHDGRMINKASSDDAIDKDKE